MQAALRATPPAGLLPRVHLTQVPFIAQPGDDLCGPAVLAMLLDAAGLPAELGALTPQVYLPGRQGTLQIEMLAGARRQGALAVELPPSLAAAFTEVAAGTPVGVLLNLGLSWWPRWHYAVLLGYDLAAGSVWLHSGEHAHAEWSMLTFENTWARSGHWAFVALRPGQLPRSADEAAVIRALIGLDRALPAAQCVPAWTAATQRWPHRLTLTMGQANAWLSAGDLVRAAAGFAQAAKDHDSAAAWNNLAQVRLQQGDRPAAREAALRAVQRASQAEPRWLDAARQTLA